MILSWDFRARKILSPVYALLTLVSPQFKANYSGLILLEMYTIIPEYKMYNQILIRVWFDGVVDSRFST